MVEGSKGSLLIYEKHFLLKKRYLHIIVETGKAFEKKLFNKDSLIFSSKTPPVGPRPVVDPAPFFLLIPILW